MACDGVLEKFPVRVSQELVDENPNFAILLRDLARNQIHSSGTSKTVQMKLEEQRSRTAVETRSLYENQSLWAELQEICWAPPTAASPPVISSIQTLNRHMALASLNGSSAPSITFGVDTDLLADVLGTAKTRAEQAAQFQTMLLPLLTERLRARLQAIASFFDSTCEDACVSSSALERFVSAVKDAQARAKEISSEADVISARTLRTSSECQKVMLRALALVQELIQQHRLLAIHKAHTVHCRWLQDREVAMEMKLGLLKNELLCDTYTPEATVALRVIRDQLALMHREATSENERADSKLRQYAAAGPPLERLAKEQSRILAEIKDREWALAKMTGTT